MSEHITVTATVAVWLPGFQKPTDLIAAMERGDNQRTINLLSFYGPPTQETFSDYLRVGEADITLRLAPKDEQTRIAVQQLNEKLDKLRAAYLEAQQEIYRQITKLQALPNEVEA